MAGGRRRGKMEGRKEREGKVEEEVREGEEKITVKGEGRLPPTPSPPNLQFSCIRGQG
jgi:hypothetical protein